MAETGVVAGRSGRGTPGPVALNGSGPGVVRRTGRRRALPSGRAMVGGMLVATSAVGLYAAYAGSEAGPTSRYVVAARPLPAGHRLAVTDLSVQPAELPPGVAGRAFATPDALAGATLIAPLAEGELVQASAVVAKPSRPGSREVAFTVEGTMLPPRLEHGERIDILATYGTGPDAVTVAVVRSVLLVALESGSGRLGDNGSTTLTVALDDAESPLALAHALALARPTVVRATGAVPPFGVDSYHQPVAPAAAPAAAPVAPAPAAAPTAAPR